MAQKPNPTPEVGDHWRRHDDGRTFLIQKLTAQYASGIWIEDDTVVRDPADESKTKTVRRPECSGGVVARSFADTSRFSLLGRGARG